MPGVGLDFLHIRQQGGRRVRHLFFQHFAVTDHGRKRRAQFVAHISQKLALGPVGCLGHVARGAQLLFGKLACGNVRMRPDPFARRPVLHDRHAARSHDPPRSIGPADPVIDAVQRVGVHGAGPGSRRVLTIVGVDRV